MVLGLNWAGASCLVPFMDQSRSQNSAWPKLTANARRPAQHTAQHLEQGHQGAANTELDGLGPTWQRGPAPINPPGFHPEMSPSPPRPKRRSPAPCTSSHQLPVHQMPRNKITADITCCSAQGPGGPPTTLT